MNDTTNHADDQQRVPNLAGKLLNVFSYVASAAVGAVTGDVLLHDAAFQKYKEKEGFTFIQQARKEREQLRKVVAEGGKISDIQGLQLPLDNYPALKDKVFTSGKGELPHEKAKAYGAIEKWMKKRLLPAFEAEGIKTRGDYFRSLDETRQLGVAGNVFAMSGITITALLTIANSKSMSHLLTKPKNEQQSHNR